MLFYGCSLIMISMDGWLDGSIFSIMIYSRGFSSSIMENSFWWANRYMLEL